MEVFNLKFWEIQKVAQKLRKSDPVLILGYLDNQLATRVRDPNLPFPILHDADNIPEY